ncbi:hypothetical protein LJD42_27135, partial [Escherichia coli]|nr:hypothetical protein [Escherichia coli]
YIQSLVYPNGERKDFYYKFTNYCSGGYEDNFDGPSCPYGSKAVIRLQAVVSSGGYLLKFRYANNSSGSITRDDYDSWSKPTVVGAYNLKNVTCHPGADDCPGSNA